ncbi:MAG: 16S rRNA (guanine(527)-N(7))-methyltransferase RsmG [Pontimonas sp.]
MFHVKHSEIEPEPIAAEKLCGEALPTLRLFAEHLAQWGEELGLVGPRELDRLWTRHILNSALVAHKIGTGTLIDIGSGAGFPGLVIAAIRPDVQCTLIEPLGRRAHWLREEAHRLGLTNVEVRNERAEEAAGHVIADFVTARAVSALKTLVPLAAPLLKQGGQLVLMKGQKVEDEVRAAAPILVKWSVSNPAIEVTGPEFDTEETRIFRATVG